MTFYSEMASVVTEMFSEFGTDVIVDRISGSEIDPVTGVDWVTPTHSNFIIKGIFKKYPDNMIDGTRITSSDRMLILEPSGGEVLLSDKLTISGQLWPIMEIEIVKPAETALIYFVRVRK